jgi:8-oxo-dGTP pyrophosphatase MutT (NUDIX family)
MSRGYPYSIIKPMNGDYISNIIEWEGVKVRYTWMPGTSDENFRPFKQVYGIVFNYKNEVLIIEENGKWQIPGGTPEMDETGEQTLTRELMEEADVKLKDIQFIGAQKVEFLKYGNPNHNEGDRFYQLRYIANLDELLPTTPDPDGGETYPRKFVGFEELIELIPWGNTGKAMFETAFAIHNKNT